MIFKLCLFETSSMCRFITVFFFFSWRSRVGLIYWFESASYQRLALSIDHLMVSVRILLSCFPIPANVLHFGPGYFFLLFNSALTMPWLILLLTVNPNMVLLLFFVFPTSGCLNELTLELSQFLYLPLNPFMSLWKYCFKMSPCRDGISSSL